MTYVEKISSGDNKINLDDKVKFIAKKNLIDSTISNGMNNWLNICIVNELISNCQTDKKILATGENCLKSIINELEKNNIDIANK
jgi:hypothetical protein